MSDPKTWDHNLDPPAGAFICQRPGCDKERDEDWVLCERCQGEIDEGYRCQNCWVKCYADGNGLCAECREEDDDGSE